MVRMKVRVKSELELDWAHNMARNMSQHQKGFLEGNVLNGHWTNKLSERGKSDTRSGHSSIVRK